MRWGTDMKHWSTYCCMQLAELVKTRLGIYHTLLSLMLHQDCLLFGLPLNQTQRSLSQVPCPVTIGVCIDHKFQQRADLEGCSVQSCHLA